MNSHYISFSKLGLLTCIIFIGGCSTSMNLRYVKPSFEEMNKGKICVVVNDQRPPEEGSNDPTRVGTIRNTFGMPFPLRSSVGREPPKVIKELVSDCLKAAGYEVVEQSNNVPQLYVVLQSFWSDGYQHNRMWMTMFTELKNDINSPPVWRYEFESNVGVTWTAGYGPFDKGFNRMLEDAKQKLIDQFKGSKFHNSFKSFRDYLPKKGKFRSEF